MRKIILHSLASCPIDMGMRKPALANEIAMDTGNKPGDGELNFALDELKRAGLVETTEDCITGDTIYIATEKARKALHR
jgi:DNA-binding PadR family transcriptional regulator